MELKIEIIENTRIAGGPRLLEHDLKVNIYNMKKYIVGVFFVGKKLIDEFKFKSGKEIFIGKDGDKLYITQNKIPDKSGFVLIKNKNAGIGKFIYPLKLQSKNLSTLEKGYYDIKHTFKNNGINWIEAKKV